MKCFAAAGMLAIALSGITAKSVAATRGTIPTIHVGDGTMSGARIHPYDNLWLVTVRRPDGRTEEKGLSSDHVRIRAFGGKSYLTRVEGTTMVDRMGDKPSGAFDMTFNVSDPATMAPVHSESYSSDGSYQIRDFSDDRVTTRYADQRGASAVQRETRIETRVFDLHGGMTGLLLAALPLRRNYAVNLPGMGHLSADLTQVRVVGQERVPAGHLGKVNAWVVEIGPAPAKAVYWISRSPPYVIKVVEKYGAASASWTIVD